MLSYAVITIILVVTARLEAKEVCCKDIGCFTDDRPFNHLPLPECPETIGVKFLYYARGGINGVIESKDIPSKIDGSRRTVFIAHGYRNSGKTSWVISMKDALLAREDVNVVIIHWEDGANHIWYPSSASNVRSVGAQAALIMDELAADHGVSYDDIWCVGFSLGAHLCGQAGLATKSKIGRITGIDPAGPSFDSYDIEAGLCPQSAQYVDAIHTDGWGLTPAYYGSLRPVGHADFYPNEGWHQPGCWTYGAKEQLKHVKKLPLKVNQTEVPYGISCSHSRANELFIASLRYTGCFVARHVCTDHNDLPGSCKACLPAGVCSVMGYEAEKNRQHGILFLETTNSDPFCRY